MVKSANLGYPRIGAKRELKKALEAYWKGEIDIEALEATGADLRAQNWAMQAEAGIAWIPSNEFSFYDQVLDTTAMLGAVPPRFGGLTGLDAYFAMARGTDAAPAMEMTKWFDTNYHYIVPELTESMTFRLANDLPVERFKEAKAQGVHTRPVLVGPVTWLALAKAKTEGLDPLSLLPQVVAIYSELLGRLTEAGADWVQIDEPILVRDLTEAEVEALRHAYGTLSAKGPKILLATYFDALGNNLDLACGLPVDGLHIDLVRAPAQLDAVLAAIGDKTLSLGLIDGRNIWRTDLSRALDLAEKAANALGRDRIEIAPSCSLLHVPVDLTHETVLDDELKGWLAFARQKLDEVVALARAAEAGREAATAAFDAADAAIASRSASARIHNPATKARTASVTAADLGRPSDYRGRSLAQRSRFRLPEFPTTTIGSFPQTAEIRKARAAHRRGDMSDADYRTFLEEQTRDCIRRQEALGLDVLVHGEFERNDMVEYFGEQLSGFAFTKNGWVQSYGSRYVKPPVIFGDVSRPQAMTVRWSAYAQSLTKQPVKGMLTGPVTVLQWSFVRDDQARAETCKQIALAIRDEVKDLEAAGIGMIQIDEPAFREGLPLRRADWDAYLRWAVDCFRLSAAGAQDETQIHTHMCYSEFNDIMPSIAALDADVISIETSRSDMELLDAFTDFSYPNEIGPGVWDIHAPRVPSREDMIGLLEKAGAVLPTDKVWVNPDCGLKTRGWPEVEASLSNLVAAAQAMRQRPAG